MSPLQQRSLATLFKCTCAAALALTLAGSASSTNEQVLQASLVRPLPTPEKLLVNSIMEISRNNLDAAMQEIDNALKTYPNFRLLHLIKGDLLLARARPLSTIGDAPNAPRQRVAELREEAIARLQRHRLALPLDRLPKYLLQMQPQQQYAVVVDISLSTLYLYQNVNGEPRYVADYYISSGKNGAEKLKEGDQRTPRGVYFVTANLPKAQLSDFYGAGAYPISYPNEWDRRHGRNGHGIWLHGTPSDTYSRPPRSSNGCVVLTNQDLQVLSKNLQIGLTPVIISERVDWINPEAWRAQRNTLAQEVEAWRRDWESRDTEAYLRHYARNFFAKSQNFNQWTRQKRQINASKIWIKVGVSNVSMFLYPGYENLAVVNFEQDYSSNNLSAKMKKRQYWIKENNRWKIAYEGAV
ncbi:MAG TPA: L,D-transpeptidase family protein [Burkholderiales bacterium]|nr:L,D-transpeptidase family protein [Burkholderiales bacterium]